MNGRLGFTLIELIMTLALISILLIIVIPSTNIYSNYLQDREINTLVRDLKTTRTRAVSEGESYTFQILQDGSGYYIQNTDNETITTIDFQFLLIHVERDSGFTFFSSGSLGGSETLRFSGSNNKTYELSVGVATGKITLKEK